jgi:two-component system nitrogen regulation response regulator GlnG
VAALADTRGNQVQAAKLLGITRATLRKRIEKFGIRRELTVE